LLLYILLCVLLTISATVESSKQQALGIYTILLIVVAIIFNLVICAYTSVKHLKLVLKRNAKALKKAKDLFHRLKDRCRRKNQSSQEPISEAAKVSKNKKDKRSKKQRAPEIPELRLPAIGSGV